MSSAIDDDDDDERSFVKGSSLGVDKERHAVSFLVSRDRPSAPRLEKRVPENH